MSLFRPLSIANAFVKVLESARGAKEGPPLRGMVTEEAIYHARARLGYEPLEHLAKSMAPTASTDTFLGLKAYAVDGVTIDVPDTPANVVGFGRQVGQRGPAAFPQLKGVALLDIGARQYVDCVWGPWNTSELVGVEMLLGHLSPGDLLFLDRRYTKLELWRQLLDRRIHFIHRLSAKYTNLRRTVQLGPGDWLVEADYWEYNNPTPQPESKRPLKRKWKRRTRATKTLRVIDYQVADSEPVRLLTDLTDPEAYPAMELALGYHLRWHIELSIDELKTHLSNVVHGTTQTTFRSKTPRGVIQEAWALLVAYNLIRRLMNEAGERHQLSALDISFVDALEVVRMAMPRLQSCSVSVRQRLRRQMISDIADCLNDRPRRKRWYPRVVKQKVGAFPLKRGHRSVRRDYKAELRLVESG
jgi:hypothetical protein